jgi:hypothetical protein
MDNRPNQLLQRRCAKRRILHLQLHRRITTISLVCIYCFPGVQVALELTEEKGVMFFAEAAHEFETHNEEGNGNAGGGEHAARGDVPGFCEETGVYCVPIPEHLEMLVGGKCGAGWDERWFCMCCWP